MVNLHELDRRYERDDSFRAMVASLEDVILHLELSPAEIRAAAMYAAYRVEMRRCPPHVIRLDDEARR